MSYLLRAQFLTDRGRHVEAAAEYSAQLRSMPDNGIVHGRLAICLSRIPRLEPAIHHAHEALRLLHECAWAHFVMAFVLFQKKDYVEADEHIRRAIQLDAEKADFFGLLASICVCRHRWSEALHAVNERLRLSPQDVHAVNQRSAILRCRRDHNSADIAALQALSLDPESSLAHVNHGLSFVAKGAYRKAFSEFSEALRLEPHSAAAQAGIIQARNARAFSVLIGFYCLTGAFLAFVAYGAGSFGCFESAVAATVVLLWLLLWRHSWLGFARKR